jgi:hypothetical protein
MALHRMVGLHKDIAAIIFADYSHLQQYHFGKPSRNAYHNEKWAAMIEAVGLVPSERNTSRSAFYHLTHLVV